MEAKIFNGKAIYCPSGRALEYSYWACNFFVGCSNGCTYCFNKKGITAKVLGGNKPILKKCFKDEKHAIKIFEKELLQNLKELKKHGLFFSFTTDPMLPKTYQMTAFALQICNDNNVPVKILTKRTDMFAKFVFDRVMCEWDKQKIIIGFTLTGHDEYEPFASANLERIEMMKIMHLKGFKTFASIEPIIDFKSSLEMIKLAKGFCDLYKIGLMSGKKYNLHELRNFYTESYANIDSKVYYKDSLIKALNIERDKLNGGKYVNRDYNMWTAP